MSDLTGKGFDYRSLWKESFNGTPIEQVQRFSNSVYDSGYNARDAEVNRLIEVNQKICDLLVAFGDRSVVIDGTKYAIDDEVADLILSISLERDSLKKDIEEKKA